MNYYIKYLKRKAIKILRPCAIFYWYLRRPHTKGVKAVVSNGNQILMIRMSYGHGMWTFPGGGLSIKEIPLQAVQREVSEEVGIHTFSEIHEIGSYQTIIEYKNDTVYCFALTVPSKDIKIDNVEVVEARWFDRDKLPTLRAKQVDKILVMYEKKVD